MSVASPGPVGTISLMGRAGQVCAAARLGMNNMAATANVLNNLFMSPSLPVGALNA